MTCCGLGHTPDEATALIPHDIYAVGTQENPQGEKEWTEHIKATLCSYTHIEFKQVIHLLETLFTHFFPGLEVDIVSIKSFLCVHFSKTYNVRIVPYLNQQ